ncbi:TetR/AcrR family transcriptional regulator [Streptomyces sp. H27-D2]|uniref:TetR/AcrR family transcriptional regulator n=1 Tax=Streptomyces sp. H27-D2 TaxID=3046304 RepID=UPI002DBEA900|nr:TetR/AcrR family transcriptional regulator [Streptomyces sp. H27-D2]MEC4020442.1 TetR/AcrR family transcriptional regulator [Streptomyces sp. H27-D2]
MASARTPRAAWIDAGLRALAAGGPDAVRIEVLARSLGVTKGGFYGYFADRYALLEEMLDAWERDVTDIIIKSVDAEGGDARDRLRNLFRIVGSRTGVTTAVSTELAIREWSRRDPAVAHRLRRVDTRQVNYLRGLFREFCRDEDEVEVRCTIVTSVRMAAHFMVFDHGKRTHDDVERMVLQRVLE